MAWKQRTYVYDHSFRRIAKTIGSTTTNYHYNEPDIQAEYTPDWGTPTVLYGHGAAMDDRWSGLTQPQEVPAITMAMGWVPSSRSVTWQVFSRVQPVMEPGAISRHPPATLRNTAIPDQSLMLPDWYITVLVTMTPQIGRFTQPDPKAL